MTAMPEVLELRVEADVVTSLAKAVRNLARGLRFSLVDQTRMITAASELARNTLVRTAAARCAGPSSSATGATGLRLDSRETFGQRQNSPICELALTDGWTRVAAAGMPGLSGRLKRLRSTSSPFDPWWARAPA